MSAAAALALGSCALLSALFVGLLYVSSAGRNKDRDSDDAIKARLVSVLAACLLSGAWTLWIVGDGGAFATLTGLAPASVLAMLTPLLMTVGLFLGPLVQLAYEPSWDVSWNSTARSWVFWRNTVFAPLAEEWVFRACMIALLVHSGAASYGACVLVPPLFFGLAHAHHVFSLMRDRGASAAQAVAAVAFQIGYTTLFGAMAAYYMLLTGSLVGPVLSHAFCNCMGFPDFAGALERRHVALAYVVGLTGYMAAVYSMPTFADSPFFK